ncbi:hypothethical protein (plasmid) [Ralstonia solanacearum CMR15]|nr:hypothethical protein [Ralstonia solanacearum CMR15]
MPYAAHLRCLLGPRGGWHLDASSVLREALALSAALYCPAYRVAAPGVVACGSRRFAASVWRLCPVRRPVRWTDWRKPNAPSGAVRPVWVLSSGGAIAR